MNCLLWLRFAMSILLTFSVLVLTMIVLIVAPSEEANASMASYYGFELAGNPTASGEIYDPLDVTVAHRSLPFDTNVLVCYEACVTARVNDRGPAAWTGREYDLSLGTARAIGLADEGVGDVAFTVL